jgi:hypothetical protein
MPLAPELRKPLQLVCVAPGYVEAMWPHVEQLIEKALQASQSDFTPAAIRQRIDRGKALLWVVWDDQSKRLLAAATTEIQTIEHGRRALIITTCAGHDMYRWKHYLAALERYAKQEHCLVVRSYGRRGWTRLLKTFGYREPWGVTDKEIA